MGHSYILQGGLASSSSPPPFLPRFSSLSSSLPPPSLLSLPLLFSLSSSIFSEFWLKTRTPTASQALLVEVTSLLNVVYIHMASLGAQMVKNLPAVQETWIRSLSWEDHYNCQFHRLSPQQTVNFLRMGLFMPCSPGHPWPLSQSCSR